MTEKYRWISLSKWSFLVRITRARSEGSKAFELIEMYFSAEADRTVNFILCLNHFICNLFVSLSSMMDTFEIYFKRKLSHALTNNLLSLTSVYIEIQLSNTKSISKTYFCEPIWYEIKRKFPSGGINERIRSL